MNKNIKWSLILSVPVLALAPVAVVASCSSTDSTNSDTKTETKTNAEIRILDLVPEIAENNTVEIFKMGFEQASAEEKQDLVFKNLTKILTGSHEVKESKQIINPQLADIPNDDTKLTLKFKLAANTWYNSEAKLSDQESNDFSITITEFAKAEKPKPTGTKTEANASVKITDIDPILKDAEAASFKAISAEMLKQMVADKMSVLFKGDHNVKTINDIESATLEEVTSENTKLTLKVVLKAEKWYKNDGKLADANSSEFSITLTDFKTPGAGVPGGKN